MFLLLESYHQSVLEYEKYNYTQCMHVYSRLRTQIEYNCFLYTLSKTLEKHSEECDGLILYANVRFQLDGHIFWFIM